MRTLLKHCTQLLLSGLLVILFLGSGAEPIKAVNIVATITDAEAQRIVDGLIALGLTRDNMQYILAKDTATGVFGVFYIRNNVPGSTLTLVEQLPSENVSGSGSQIFYHKILTNGTVERVCSTAQCYMNNFLLGPEWAVVEANLPVSTQYGSWVFEYNPKITALWQSDEEGLTQNDRGFLSGLFNGIFNFFGDLVDNLLGFSNIGTHINSLVSTVQASFGVVGDLLTFPITILQTLIGSLGSPSCSINAGSVDILVGTLPLNFSFCEWNFVVEPFRWLFTIIFGINLYHVFRDAVAMFTGNIVKI